MRIRIPAVAAAAVLTLTFVTGTVAADTVPKAAAWKPPRGPDRVHPDLNGVWQVLNTANYDWGTRGVTY